jgi:hypothetical protein
MEAIMKIYTASFILLLFCIACATVDVSYDFDQQFNFAGIKTYDWLSVPDKTPWNELTLKHINYAVNNELQAKGLTMTSTKPDVLIALHGGKEKRVDVQEWGYAFDDSNFSHGGYFPGRWRSDAYGPGHTEYRRGTDTYEYELGTLIIDIVDTEKKSLVWRGTAVGVVEPGRTMEQINETVKKMLVNFPPGQKK